MASKKFWGLLIDLDNCLYEYNICNEAAVKAVIKNLAEKSNKSIEETHKIYLESRKEIKSYTNDTASSHSRLLYIQRTVEKLFGRTEIKIITKLHSLFWKEYFSKMHLYDGVAEFLNYVKLKGVKIVIVTDLTADIQMKKLVHLNLANKIDFLVTSEEAGHDKPHQNIFNLAISKLNLKPSEVLMIGEDKEKDIAGAKNLGIEAISVNKNNFKDGSLTRYFE